MLPTTTEPAALQLDNESKPFGCFKNTIRLLGGTYLDLLNPQPDQFTLSDIAGALSKICRFGGQVPLFYSVAEHCVHAANIAIEDGHDSKTCAAVLMHDAAEAFLGDIVKPLKVMLPEYAELERRMEEVIGAKFGIDWIAAKDVICEIDRAMLIAERKTLFIPDGVKWHGEDEARVVEVYFRGWLPWVGNSNFLDLACRLHLT